MTYVIRTITYDVGQIVTYPEIRVFLQRNVVMMCIHRRMTFQEFKEIVL